MSISYEIKIILLFRTLNNTYQRQPLTLDACIQKTPDRWTLRMIVN